MSNQNLTELLIILDRSGSMEPMAAEVVGGLNHFLDEQKKLPGVARLTLVQFDHVYEVVHAARPLAEVPTFTRDSFQPRGSTALLDAIGRAFAETGARLAAQPEDQRPSKVIACIITDGQENSSKEYRLEHVRAALKEQQETYSWVVVFIGAGPEAFAQGRAIGMNIQNLAMSTPDAQGTRAVYAAVNKLAADVREHGALRSSVSNYVGAADHVARSSSSSKS